MKKAEKTFLVDNLTRELKDSKSTTFINYQGLSTRDLASLRESIKEAGGHMLVVKNTLLKLALEKTEIPEEGLQGPTAIVIAENDEIAPLQKMAKTIAEKGLPKLKFGIFYNEILDTDKLTALSKLPSKSVLLGQLLSYLSAPTYGLITTLQGNLQSLVYLLDQKSREVS